MPKANLSDRTVRALDPPDKGQVVYWDKAFAGFGVRISQGGTKSFIVMYGANRQRTTIGRYPVISLADARTEAKRILAEVTLGQTQLRHIAVADAVDKYLLHCRPRLRPNTYAYYKRMLMTRFSLGRVSLSDVSAKEIMRRLNSLSDRPAEQNQLFVVLRGFYRWCVRQHLLDKNPIDGLALPNKPSSRDRVLTEHETAEILRTALEYRYPYGPIVALLVLTGQRRSEISHLHVDWIDHEDRTITIPSEVTKNHREHRFPYGKLAECVIENIPITDGYLFPAARAHVRGKDTTVFNGWSKAKTSFDKKLNGVNPYRIHDFRRTFSSTLASFGVPIHVTERLINHASGAISGVAAVYNRYSYMDEMRDAISKHDAYIESLVNSPTYSNLY